MRRVCLLFIIVCSSSRAGAQNIAFQLNKGWQFRQAGTTKWYKAEVPGTVHTDLISNGLIPDPFYRDNESKVQWVEGKAWEYQISFDVSDNVLQKKNIEIDFDGLDTYAEVWLNDKKIIEADNMFRQWSANVKSILKRKGNKLHLKFLTTSLIAKEKKNRSPIHYPENERVFVRKAQYQFGWDWGPRLVTCGIWKYVRIVGYNQPATQKSTFSVQKKIRLVTEKDSIGESFYFMVDGKPTFIKGVNWIPSDNFLTRVKKLKRYEQLIKAAKEAHINLLRVWGGGVYEDDEFYDLCDKYGIMVWQDFMFAGAMYPVDSAFLKNIEEEIRYQVKRLRNHPCIALWCGNNEIEEAWFNWGWQKQFNYSAEDSAKLWNDYKKIFHQLIPDILKALDPGRPYWPSSPSLGWGRDSAYKKGDVHYWGVWWGKEPVEKYNEKIGRFMSEYGMQGIPDMKTIKQFSLPQDWDTSSIVMKTHQKHPFGWANIKYYIEQKFRTPKTFENLVYVSQLMQADAIKIAIEAHRRNKPITMGTMFWQWNDCWPVTSWSAIDYYGRKKAMYYEVKRSFSDAVFVPHYDSTAGVLLLKGANDLDKPVEVKGRFYDFVKGVSSSSDEYVSVINPSGDRQYFMISILTPQQKENGVYCFDVKSYEKLIHRNFVFAYPPKQLNLPRTKINYEVGKNSIILQSGKFAYGVFIDVPDGVELDDNYFHLLPNEKKIVNFTSIISLEKLKRSIKIKSLVDTY